MPVDWLKANAVGSGSDRFHRWRQLVGGLTRLPAMVRGMGGDADAVIQSAMLPAHALDAADGSIPYASFGSLLEHSVRRTGRSSLPLALGASCRVRDLGLLGQILFHSRTVGSALEALVRYQHLNGEGGLVFMTRRGAVAELGYAIYYPGVHGASAIYDYMLAALHGLMAELCGSAWQASEVFLPCSRPADARAHRELFGAPPRFDATFCALRFPAYWLHRELTQAEPQRRAVAVARAEEIGEPDFEQRVYRAVRATLLDANNSGEDVARYLSMHRRTLNRRLREEGITFRQVLEDVRLEIARELLWESNATLDDIAAAVGYSGLPAFLRRFKQWTGSTPAAVRRARRREGHVKDGEALWQPSESEP